MRHIVLAGDSIFDNQAYVEPGEPDVIKQMQAALSAPDRATLLAIDGSVIRGVAKQLERLPAATTHLVISAGGNDVLGYMGQLNDPVSSGAEALLTISQLSRQFETMYAEMLELVLTLDCDVMLCTIYNPRFPEPLLQTVSVTGLTAFNDVIVRLASAAGLPLLDLRQVCDDDADYANPIEPSMQGGTKITQAILSALAVHDFQVRRTVIYIG